MRRYLMIGGAGLLAVVIIAVVMFQQNRIDLPDTIQETVAPEGSADLLDHVPNDFDQAVLMDVDEGLISVMQTMEQDTAYGSGLQESLGQVDYLLATQYQTDVDMFSLLFVGADNQVALQDIRETGIIAGGSDYEVRQVADGLWVYGDPSSLDFFDRQAQGVVADNDQMASYLNDVLAGEYNIGFASKPVAPVGQQNNMMVQQFANQLSYTIVRSHLAPQDIYGQVILQFVQGVIPQREQSFAPKLASQAPADALVYVELADILGMFGIGEQQFVGLLPALLGAQGEAFGAALSSDQYQAVYNVLSDHIAIAISPADNMFGVGAEVMFGHADAFEVITSLRPLLLGLAGGIVGTGTLQELPAEEGFSYGVTGLPVAGEQPVLELGRQGDTATLSVLGKPSGDRGLTDLPHNDQTSITFQIDSAGLQNQLSSSASAMNPLAPSMQAMGGVQQPTNYVSGGILQGNVQMVPDDDQMRIDFTVIEQQ